MIEPIQQFEGRKRDHIALALKSENEALGGSGLERIDLLHDALPELNFSEINIETQTLGINCDTPFLVSSMTAGHADSKNLNLTLARACEKRDWLMGVGSQRRELFDAHAREEWRSVRAAAPHVKLIGNLGLSQIIHASLEQIEMLVESISARAMFIHLNPLQECLQPEGIPEFKGGIAKLAELAKKLSVPVIVKETGCGFSRSTLQSLNELGLAGVDVSGFGGTHWGRIEGKRNVEDSIKAQVAATFSHWGVSTLESLLNAQAAQMKCEVWASGGIRTGLDAAKAFALGARIVGFAKPILEAALVGEKQLLERMEIIETELKVAMYCTGSQNLTDLNKKWAWKWHQSEMTP